MSVNNRSENVSYLPVAGFLGYCVGSDGTIWSCRPANGRGPLRSGWQLIKPYIGRRGYASVAMRRGGKTCTCRVHRLVLTAFVSPRPDGMEACHWNGNPADNRLVNLRWGSPAENYADMVRHGTTANRAGEASGRAKLTESDVLAIRQRYDGGGVTYQALASEYHVTNGAIGFIVRRELWKHC